MKQRLDAIKGTRRGLALVTAFIALWITIVLMSSYGFSAVDAFLVSTPVAVAVPVALKYPFGLLNEASTERKILAYLAPWSVSGAVFVLATNPGVGETPTLMQAGAMLMFVACMGTVYFVRIVNTDIDGVMAGLKVTGISFGVSVVLMEIASSAGVVSTTAAGEVETTALGAVVAGFALTSLLGAIATLLAGALVWVSWYRNRTPPSEVLEQEASN